MQRSDAAAVLARLQEAQGAFYAGGPAAPLRALLAEDVVWRVPGENAIAGVYEGAEAVMAYFARRRDLAGGTFRMRPGELLTGEGDHVAVLTDGTAVIGGREHRWSTVGLYRVRDGRIAACSLLPLDPQAFDAIWRPAVAVVEHDPGWAAAARAEIARLAGALGPVAVRLEHIGSTAVPGLAAKPVVDLQLSVAALAPVDAYEGALARLGYGFVAAAGDPGRRFYGLPLERPRTHHLHVVEAGSLEERRHLAVRDHLRADAAEAARYGEHKRALARRFEGDYEGYVAAKEPYVRALEARALGATAR